MKPTLPDSWVGGKPLSHKPTFVLPFRSGRIASSLSVLAPDADAGSALPHMAAGPDHVGRALGLGRQEVAHLARLLPSSPAWGSCIPPTRHAAAARPEKSVAICSPDFGPRSCVRQKLMDRSNSKTRSASLHHEFHSVSAARPGARPGQSGPAPRVAVDQGLRPRNLWQSIEPNRVDALEALTLTTRRHRLRARSYERVRPRRRIWCRCRGALAWPRPSIFDGSPMLRSAARPPPTRPAFTSAVDWAGPGDLTPRATGQREQDRRILRTETSFRGTRSRVAGPRLPLQDDARRRPLIPARNRAAAGVVLARSERACGTGKRT